VVGLSVTALAGSQWRLAPQFRDLTSAEAGFTTPLGGFSAGWALEGGEVGVWWLVPGRTTGTTVTPGGPVGIVVVDGRWRALPSAE
jgi:hypothetical protein